MISAFLFDLDGTLLDSEILWVESIQRALAELGSPISDAQALELVYGRAWRDIRERIHREYPASRDGDFERHIQRIFDELKAVRDIRIHSSIELLKRLGSHYPVAIVSGSTRSTIAESVRLMGAEPYVRLFVSTEDCVAGKPDPECFLLAARRLGVAPESCLVFEDSSAGVRAAKAAGMRCVALRRPERPAQDLSMADEVLEDLSGFTLEHYRGDPAPPSRPRP